jgi:hypothetical protein
MHYERGGWQILEREIIGVRPGELQTKGWKWRRVSRFATDYVAPRVGDFCRVLIDSQGHVRRATPITTEGEDNA